MPAARRLLLALALTLALIVIVPRPVQASSTATSAAQASLTATSAAQAVVAAARALIGAPYAYIGDDPQTGFSCIGFVHYLYGRIGVDVPYNLDLAYAAGPRVTGPLQPGDLVFFSNTVWKGLSHVALYVGGGQMIGADNFTTGVEETRLADPYWASRYTGATRPLSTVTTLPPPPIVARPDPPAPQPAPAPAVRVGQLLSARQGGDVYSGPGFGYQRIDRLAARASLRVVRVAAAWADVTYRGSGGDYYGWVDGAYLAACSVVAVPAPPRSRPGRAVTPVSNGPRARFVVVTVPVLFLRGGPSTAAPILARLTQGERLSLLNTHGAWDHLRAGHISGWAYAHWLLVSK